MSVTVTVVDDDNVTVQVSDTALPLELYQLRITVSETEPVDPEEGDLWLDIS
jgi:hypothetical protein